MFGVDRLWIAGRGGSILKRSEPLSTLELTSPKIAPILRMGNNSRNKPKTRQPLLTITDDGDIPLATPPKKEN